jgi:hypothetical protein
MANQVDFKILPSDQFNVYSPQTRSDKIITYFTLLSKLRGDILAVGQEDDPNDIVSAFYSSVGGTQTLHLVKADGSEITASVPEPTVGTVTSVDLTASTGISVSGGPITTSGSITVTNTAPDQVVVLTGAGTTSISGTYPSFTITSNDQFVGTVTSVGLTMPAAFSVANSPVTASGTLAVTAAGLSSQYIRGDGQLANFPTPGGGGSSVNYYLNGSVSQGTFGGDTYYELSKTPIAGAGTNFTRAHGSGDGYIASFITDANDPDQINIPGGNWNLEFYFNSSSSGGSPAFYGELYKVSVSNVFTLIASGSVNPESITGGTTIDQYYTSIAVPQTALLSTDRLAIRVYVIVSGKNITLHTENSNFSEVITTFSTGLNSLNGLSDQVQYFAVGTSGTDFAISSSVDTHTFNLPTASATNRGALSSADWTTFNSKEPALTKGNLTEATSAVLTITGGTGAVIGTGTTIQVAQSGASTSGFLSSTDWNTFNGKQSALTFSAPLVNTSGTVSIPAATSLVDGYLSAANFVTFNGKQDALTLTTTGSTGAATLIGATLNIPNYADQFVGTVTSVNMSVPTGFAISGNPITTSGTLAVAFATGYSLPTDAIQANWTAAYNDKINSASFDTSTGVITLTQQDAGTVTVDIDGRFILLSEKGAANGVATLDAGGKLPVSQLPSSVFEYKGTWNAATNTPTLANGTGDPGDVYRCTVAGTVNFGAGAISFEIGDLVIYDGTEWQKSESTDAVTSVNGYTGTVVLTTSDISEGTNLYFTTARARQSLSAGTAISYDNSTGVITNSAPDQIVAITAGTGTSVTGTYPNFTISATGTGGTVTSVDLTAGTGISVSGGPITTSGSITVTNTAPDQVVSITGAGTTSVTGTYPSFTITSNDQYDGTVTSVDMSVPTGFAISGNPITTSGTLALAFASGYSLPTNASQANWDTAYNNSITAFSYNTSTGVLTLTQQDAGTLTATVTLAPFDTDDLAEGATNKYDKTVALTGAGTTTITGTYPSFTITSNDEFDGTVTSVATTAPITGGTITTTGTIGITQSGAASDGYLSSTDWNTFNSKEPSLTKGNLTEATSSVLTITGGTNAVIGTGTTIQVSQAGASSNGYLSSTDWNTFNDKQDAITLTTTGTSGVATLIGATLNIPDYTEQYSGTVTSVATTAPITGGTITTTGTIGITQAGAASDGYLSSADWTTFNSKQGALTFTAPLVNTSGTITITQSGAATDGYLSSTDWNTFNGKEPALTKGNLTEVTSAVLTITNGTNAVIGSGTSIQVAQSSSTTNGYLSSTDWSTFNGKASNSFTTITVATQSNIVAGSATDTLTIVAGTGVAITTDALTDTLTISATGSGGTVTSIDTTAPITGGTITGTGTIGITQSGAAADGYLTSTDWNTFNGKQDALTFSAPLVNTSGTISISQSGAATDGYLSSTDWNTFNGKQDAITLTTTGTSGAATLIGCHT